MNRVELHSDPDQEVQSPSSDHEDSVNNTESDPFGFLVSEHEPCHCIFTF